MKVIQSANRSQNPLQITADKTFVEYYLKTNKQVTTVLLTQNDEHVYTVAL